MKQDLMQDLLKRLNRANGNRGAFFEYVPPQYGDLCWFCKAPVSPYQDRFAHAYGATAEAALSGVLRKLGAMRTRVEVAQ